MNATDLERVKVANCLDLALMVSIQELEIRIKLYLRYSVMRESLGSRVGLESGL